MPSTAEKLKALEDRVASVIRGKREAIGLAIATLLARGHLLIEDVPGVGKTTLAFTLARAIDCSFQRIQFTSDMLPSDITGVSIFNYKSREFEFRQGPLFANIVLADEINRTTPKTQSALLEAMNERRVSVDRRTHALPEPFMVIATQNPIEYRGTFPLPESQMDRFALHLRLGYPSEEYEKQALVEQMDFYDIERLEPVLEGGDILLMQREADGVSVQDSVLEYLMAVISGTRENEAVSLGASTRGGQFLLKVAKAVAYSKGRDFLVPDDVKEAAPYVLGHRIILKRKLHISDADRLIREILQETPVPV
jgi:MoxR-like ATPase